MATITLTCRSCGNDFQCDPVTFKAIGLPDLPKDCPACNDKKQDRPATAIVKGRNCLAEFPAVCVFLPAEKFAPFRAQSKDKPCLRATFKGSDLYGGGDKWDGRLDVYVLADAVPSVARLRVMQVEHEEGHRRIERRKDVANANPYASLSHPGQPKIDVEVEYPATYQYLVLEPVEAEPVAALVMPQVQKKTTMKGLGRQWYASLDASRALWHQLLSRESRGTGRFWTQGVIAVVDDEHYVETKQWGDISSHYRYTMSQPKGEDIDSEASAA